MIELKRDLTADLAICGAATGGDDWTNFCPVRCDHTTIVSEYDRLTEEPCALIAECERVEDATFIAEARTGWPHAIKRAMDAEIRMEMAEHAIGSHDRACRREMRRLEAEVERLRAVLERMDDRKHAMMPRSQMARLAKEALDYAAHKETGSTED